MEISGCVEVSPKEYRKALDVWMLDESRNKVSFKDLTGKLTVHYGDRTMYCLNFNTGTFSHHWNGTERIPFAVLGRCLILLALRKAGYDLDDIEVNDG